MSKKLRISQLKPARGMMLVKVEEENDDFLVGDQKTSEIVTVVRMGPPGDVPVAFKEGSKVIVRKLNGKRHEEDGVFYMPIAQHEAIGHW